MPILEMYKRHLADYDLKTVEEISGAPAALVRRLAEDIWKTTKAGHPVAIHIGEGINHYFHATLHNRATYLPMMLDRQHRQARRRRLHLGRQLQGGAAAGLAVERAGGRLLHRTKTRSTPSWTRRRGSPTSTCATSNDGEDPSYWACGERVADRRNPRGAARSSPARPTCPPRPKPSGTTTPTSSTRRSGSTTSSSTCFPRIDMIVDQQIEWTGVGRVRRRGAAGQLVGRVPGPGDAAPRARTRSSRSGRGGSSRFTTRVDDGEVFAGVARALAEQTGDRRFADYFKFITEKKATGLPSARLGQLHDDPRHRWAVPGRQLHGRRVRRRAGGGPDALPDLSARAVLGADPRLDPLLHRQRPAGQLLRHARGDRIRREPGRASRGGRGHALPAQRDRLHQPVTSGPRTTAFRATRPIPTCARSATSSCPGPRSSRRSIRSGTGLSASSARRPRAGTRRTPRGPRSIGTGSGATTSATRTAPTSGRRAWPTARSR